MVLNNHSFVHVEIRKCCTKLELLTGMKLITDLNSEFVEIRLMNKLGYIVIKWDKNACFTLSHHLTEVELAIVQNILIYLNWLETGQKINALTR